MPASAASWAPPLRSPTIWPPMARVRIGEVMPMRVDPGQPPARPQALPEAGGRFAAGGARPRRRAEGPPLPDPRAVTPEEGAAARQLERRLERLVAELPPKQRAALLLSRMDGLAYRDVAEAIGSTEGAVKALLFRATQTLKRGLREYL